MRLTRSQQTTEIDAKIAVHAIHALKDAQPTRTTVTDDLLPTERVQLQEHPEIKLVNYETTPFGQLTRKFKQPPPQKLLGDDDAAAATTFVIGDTVEIKSCTKVPLIAVIVSLHRVSSRFLGGTRRGNEEELLSEWKATVHRFELAGSTRVNRKVRPHEPNEVYYLVKDALLIDACSILNHCRITPKTKKPSTAKGKAKLTEYVIEASYDPVTGIYYPIKWDDFHSDRTTVHETDRVSLWNVKVEPPPSRRRGRGRAGAEEDSDESSGDDSSEEEEPLVLEPVSEEDSGEEDVIGDEEIDVPGPEPPRSESETESSPRKRGGAASQSKKRKRIDDSSTLTTHTPVKKKRKGGVTQPTPHSKAALRARKKFKIRPPADFGQDNTTLYTMEDDPFLRAMHTLHVGERPDSLPCRDEEYVNIFENVIGLLQEASGGCIYISGVPGTGKTATVHTVIRELKIMALNNECNPFTFVEINGLRVPEPSAAYPLLWEAVTGHDASAQGHLKISPKEAFRRLEIHFGEGASENTGPACIVLMDELDQLVTTKQDVVYNFFNWPNLVGSRLIVLAVANTHDLPERALHAKVRSRLGMVRINFAPYTKAQLAEIVNSRLSRAKQGAFNVQTVMKPDAVLYAATRVGGVSGDARRVLDICRRTVERIRDKTRAATIADVMHVISLTQNTPTAGYVAQCSFHEKAMLAAALVEVRWTGVEEFTWAKLRGRYLGLLHQLNADEDDDGPQRTPSEEEMSHVLDSLVHSDFLSIENTAVANRKPLADRKIVMTVEKQEVKRVLVETGQRWHAHLGVDV